MGQSRKAPLSSREPASVPASAGAAGIMPPPVLGAANPAAAAGKPAGGPPGAEQQSATICQCQQFLNPFPVGLG